MTAKRRRQVTLNMPDALYSVTRSLACIEGISHTAWLNRAIQQAVNACRQTAKDLSPTPDAP